jgi:4-hydroxybenzoate polyprenyltransferase
MTANVALRLGRVSNVPTVWTNALAGVVLADGALGLGGAVRLGIALSLFYVGGMYLNDAFDHAIDARERPTRPGPCRRARCTWPARGCWASAGRCWGPSR